MNTKPAGIFDEEPPRPVRPDPAQLRALAEQENFPSREARPAAGPTTPGQRHKPRLYRTGRNTPFSCKITQHAYERIYAIADQQDWKVGETLERALVALEREIERKRAGEG